MDAIGAVSSLNRVVSIHMDDNGARAGLDRLEHPLGGADRR